MVTLREVLTQAGNEGVAVGHFNVSDLVTLKAVFESATDENVPVVVGVSEGERQFFGLRQIVALVKSLREEYSLPIFLNADHTHSMANAIEAAKAGVDWIVFDVSILPLYQHRGADRLAVRNGCRPVNRCKNFSARVAASRRFAEADCSSWDSLCSCSRSNCATFSATARISREFSITRV